MDSFDAVFVFSDEGDGDDNVKFQEGKSEGSVSMNFSGGTFDEMPAWKFLSSMNMTELPNMKGVGVGVHLTTCCWQIRYPPTSPGKQASVARSWGKLSRKGMFHSAKHCYSVCCGSGRLMPNQTLHVRFPRGKFSS